MDRIDLAADDPQIKCPDWRNRRGIGERFEIGGSDSATLPDKAAISFSRPALAFISRKDELSKVDDELLAAGIYRATRR